MLIVGASLVFVYILGGVFLYVFQEKFIFLDGELPTGFQYAFDADYEEVNLKGEADGSLNALHFKVDNPKGLVLYFHGNQGNLTRWGKVVLDFTKFGYDVIVMDYRGYGKSSGKRSKEILLNDAELFYQYALNNYLEKDITLYGRSLGTGIASWLAGRHSPKSLILETPYYSLASVAQRFYPVYPSKLALRYNFRSYKYLQRADCPIYIFHGTEDEVVPYKSGKRLYKSLSPDQVQMITIEGGRHKDLADFDTFNSALQKVLVGR